MAKEPVVHTVVQVHRENVACFSVNHCRSTITNHYRYHLSISHQYPRNQERKYDYPVFIYKSNLDYLYIKVF